MSGKKKIAYPIDLEFCVGEPIYFNNAQDKYVIHKELIDKLLGALKGTFHVGYVKRERNFVHGINAHSLNEAIREKLKTIDEIQGETDVVFGSLTFLYMIRRAIFIISGIIALEKQAQLEMGNLLWTSISEMIRQKKNGLHL